MHAFHPWAASGGRNFSQAARRRSHLRQVGPRPGEEASGGAPANPCNCRSSRLKLGPDAGAQATALPTGSPILSTMLIRYVRSAPRNGARPGQALRAESAGLRGRLSREAMRCGHAVPWRRIEAMGIRFGTLGMNPKLPRNMCFGQLHPLELRPAKSGTCEVVAKRVFGQAGGGALCP